MPVLGLYGAANRRPLVCCRLPDVRGRAGQVGYRSRPPCGAGEACSVVGPAYWSELVTYEVSPDGRRIIARRRGFDALRVQVLVVSAAEGGQVRGAAPNPSLVGAQLVLE